MFMKYWAWKIENHFVFTHESSCWSLEITLAYFAWMHVHLVYQLEVLVYDKVRTCALVFHFLYIFWIFHAQCKFGQTDVWPIFWHVLNLKMENQAWSFLVTIKWSFCDIFESLSLKVWKPLCVHPWEFMLELRGYTSRCCLNACTLCLSIGGASIWQS